MDMHALLKKTTILASLNANQAAGDSISTSNNKKGGSFMSMRSARKKGKRTPAILNTQNDAITTGEPVVLSSPSHSLLNSVYSTPEFQLDWDSDIGHHVARNLIHLRQFRGLSQVEVAKAMGTSQPAVARIESGTENVGSDTFRRLIKVLRGRVQVWITPHEEPICRWGHWWEISSTTYNLVAFMLQRDGTKERIGIGLERSLHTSGTTPPVTALIVKGTN